MANYYEILQIPHTATLAEIEAAYEQQYNHWRRLVTHHDPNIVNQANQALQQLEKIKIALTDPAQRETYDAEIGLRGPVGGLADVEARPQPAGPAPRMVLTPPLSPKLQQPAAALAGERVDAWVCPKCQTPNAVQSLYCKSCGQTIGQACPNCGHVIEAEAQFCTKCGSDVQKVVKRKEIEAQIAAKQADLARLQASDSDPKQEIKYLKRAVFAAIAWTANSFSYVIAVTIYLVLEEFSAFYNSDIIVWLVLGLQVLLDLILAVTLGVFSLSAILALITGIAQLVGGVGPWGSLAYILAGLGLGYTLQRYRRYAWGLAALVVLSAAVPLLISMWWRFSAWILVPGLIQSLSFGIMSVLAWRSILQTKRQAAEAASAKNVRIESLRREITQLSHELQVL